jgi:NTP pyrophosphatase (non-canonical NTP hydrolase)
MMHQLDTKHADMVAKLSKSGEQIKEDLTPHQAAVWHHATGVGTEAGELLTAAKAYSIYGKPVDRENVIEELGDLEFYMQGLRMELGITREATLMHNMEKLAKRYPNYQYTNDRATARADKA